MIFSAGEVWDVGGFWVLFFAGSGEIVEYSNVKSGEKEEKSLCSLQIMVQ